MIQKPMDILSAYPVRKGRKQKQAFRADVTAYLKTIGYEAFEEKGSFGSRNLVFGDPEKAEYLVTAHYDTCARLPFPNLITPCNLWTFLAYQLFMACVMLLVPAIPGVAVGLLTESFQIGYYVWYASFWVVFVLMLFGPANKTNVNDNTSGVVTVLEIAGSLPENYRDKVCFVLFDLEEAGLIGSASYYSAHKAAAKNQIVLNLDCVGDGDRIMLFPTKKLKKDAGKMERLRRCVRVCGQKTVGLRSKGFSVYPSDQANFPYGVGIAAFRCSKRGILYCSRIHTPRDTVLEITNVNILRAAIISMICSPAAK